MKKINVLLFSSVLVLLSVLVFAGTTGSEEPTTDNVEVGVQIQNTSVANPQMQKNYQSPVAKQPVLPMDVSFQRTGTADKTIQQQPPAGVIILE